MTPALAESRLRPRHRVGRAAAGLVVLAAIIGMMVIGGMFLASGGPWEMNLLGLLALVLFAVLASVAARKMRELEE